MHGFCNRCGKCCEAIRIDVSPDEARQHADELRSLGRELRENERDWVFVDEHWRNISEEEAFRINPVLRLQKEAGLINDDVWYYTCDRYDAERRLCGAHEDRPRVCRGYPNYGKDWGEYMTWYSPTCDYINDNALPGERQMMIELALEMEKA